MALLIKGMNFASRKGVDFYLHCIELETDFNQSDSHDIVMQTFTDVADLEVKNYGKLECRPVLSNTEVCQVPPEVWSDRIGYLVVHLNESLKQAKIIGFAPTVVENEGILSLSKLRALAEFSEYLSQIHQLKRLSNSVKKTVVNLSHWLQNIFEPDWQSFEALFGIKTCNLSPLREDLDDSSMKRIKLIDLGVKIKHQSLALLVGLKPETDKIGIRVQLRPTIEETNLPSNLKLTLLSSSGETIQEVHSRPQDDYIQLKRWRSKPGTRFSLQVTLNDLSLTEDFLGTVIGLRG